MLMGLEPPTGLCIKEIWSTAGCLKHTEVLETSVTNRRTREITEQRGKRLGSQCRRAGDRGEELAASDGGGDGRSSGPPWAPATGDVARWQTVREAFRELHRAYKRAEY